MKGTAMFTLKIKTDNAAFRGDDGSDDGARNIEVASILRSIAIRLENGDECGFIRDSNGNNVGKWKFGR
jgi:hypothetical protein